MAVMTQSIPEELTTFLETRKNLYQFLHFLFQKPVYESLLLELKDDNSIIELTRAYDGGKILSKFFKHLSKKYMKQVQEEYQRLFLGPGPVGAPPWESYYRSKDYPSFEKWNGQVRRQYLRYGLTFIKENNESDDHLLIELEYMIFLINTCLQEKKLEQLRMIVSEQISFIENHFVKWIPMFCQRVIDCSNSQLYVGAAMLLEDFLGYDLESLHKLHDQLARVTI